MQQRQSQRQQLQRRHAARSGLCVLCKYQLRRSFAAAHLILLTQLAKSAACSLPPLRLLPLPRPRPLLLLVLLLELPLLMMPLSLLLFLLLVMPLLLLLLMLLLLIRFRLRLLRVLLRLPLGARRASRHLQRVRVRVRVLDIPGRLPTSFPFRIPPSRLMFVPDVCAAFQNEDN